MAIVFRITSLFVLFNTFGACIGDLKNADIVNLLPAPIEDEFISKDKLLDLSGVVYLEGENLDNIDKIYALDDAYYIYNSDSDARFLSFCIYDNHGKLLNERSDFDYVLPNKWFIKDFLVDSSCIELLDRLSKKIYQFDLNGNYVQTLKNDNFGSRFYKIKNNTYLFYRDGSNVISESLNNHFYLFSNGKIGYTFDHVMNIFTLQALELLPNFFDTAESGTAICASLFNDTLYEASLKGNYPKYLITLPNNEKKKEKLRELNEGFDRSKLDYVVNEMGDLLNNPNYCRGLNYFFRYSDKIILSYRFNNSFHLVIFNLDGNKIAGYELPYLRNEFYNKIFKISDDTLGIAISNSNEFFKGLDSEFIDSNLNLDQELNPTLLVLPIDALLNGNL